MRFEFAFETDEGAIPFTFVAKSQHDYTITPSYKWFFEKEPLILDSGRILSNIRVGYHTYGTLNAEKDNAILVCHALTGTSAVHRWWADMFGEGKTLDPTKHFIVCSNVLGGCSGTSGPKEIGLDPITIHDMVRVQKELIKDLGIKKLTVIGGSMGGMQALEWVRSYPECLKKAIIVGAPPRHSAWAKSFNVSQRNAITSDPEWKGGRYSEQPHGLAIARQIAMISYRSPESYQMTQGGQSKFKPGQSAIQTYLEYHGEKLLKRFDANTYLLITQAMDLFEVTEDELRRNTVPTLVVGISTDILYPASEVREMAAQLSNSEYWQLESPHGHDAFLIEDEALNQRMLEFLGQ